MRISIVANKIEFDKKGFVTSTFKGLRAQMLEAAAMFVQVAASRVPIFTGQARGSYLNLLLLLDRNSKGDKDLGAIARATIDGRGIPTEAQKRKKNGRYYRHYQDGNNYRKQPATAKKFSTSSGQIIKREGDSISFKYQIDLSYYLEMDENNPFKNSWHSIRRGKTAFMETLAKYKPEGVLKYMIVSTQTSISDDKGGFKVQRNQKTVK